MTPDGASLIAKEKESKKRYDRALAAMKSQTTVTDPTVVKAEVDEAKREWENARKRLELFQAERSSD